MKVVGIDLAGKPENDTGFCVLEDHKVRAKTLKSDEEVIESLEEEEPDLVAIDAPFNFPDSGQYRESDMLLKKMGFDPLSPTFPGMKILVHRAKKLIKELERIDSLEIIEVYSRASEKIIPIQPSEDANEDKFDALLCALTGKRYLEGDYEDLSGIIIPKG
ncbi:MAG: DUF429 domain-containing protein [Candidatus Aenigmatarchaeota archaeon]